MGDAPHLVVGVLRDRVPQPDQLSVQTNQVQKLARGVEAEAAQLG